MKKYNKVFAFKLPNGKMCASCRTCIHYDTSSKDSRGWGWCQRIGGYRSPSESCGYYQ